MKRSILFLLLILYSAGTSYGDDTSTDFDCFLSFELGAQDAQQVSTWKWFWTAWLITSISGISGFLIELNSNDANNEGIPTAVGELAGAGISITLPLFFGYHPKSLSNENQIATDCYTKGYEKRLRNRNLLASAGGIALGIGTVYVAIYTIGMFYFISEFD